MKTPRRDTGRELHDNCRKLEIDSLHMTMQKSELCQDDYNTDAGVHSQTAEEEKT